MPSGRWRSGPSGRCRWPPRIRRPRTPAGRWAGTRTAGRIFPVASTCAWGTRSRPTSSGSRRSPRPTTRSSSSGPCAWSGARSSPGCAAPTGPSSTAPSRRSSRWSCARHSAAPTRFVRLGCGDEAEWMVRQALQVSPYDERLYRALLVATAAQGNRVRLHCGHGPAADAGRRGGPSTSPDGRGRPRRTASILRRRTSTVTCSSGRLPREGTPPGCRVATRHGEKLFWEISRTRRRNGRRHHLPRADAGELVRRARHHRHHRGGLHRRGQVQLQQGADGRRADRRDVVARRPGLRHLRDHGGGAPGLAQHRHDGPHDHRERRPRSSSRRGRARPATMRPWGSSPTGIPG